MNKKYLQKTLIGSAILLWIVVLLVERKLTTLDFTCFGHKLGCSNLTVLNMLCFLIGNVNIVLGTIFIEYTVIYITIIITFLFLDYGLILSCIKTSYETVIMGNNIDDIITDNKIKAIFFTIIYLLPFTNQINYLTLS